MPLIPRRRSAAEILDMPPEAYGVRELEGSLADIRMVNRYLGDLRALLKHLAVKARGLASFTVLDVATGSGDIPVAIAKWARNNGVGAAITAVDINERTVEIARKECAEYPEIRIEAANGLNLPYPDKSFDFVICSKTTHHFSEEDIVRLMKEMLRVGRRGYFIMDLRRSWIAYALIWVLTRIFTRNRLTQNDGPLSVLKAFTSAELAALAEKAGATHFAIHREPFWLLVLCGDLP